MRKTLNSILIQFLKYLYFYLVPFFKPPELPFPYIRLSRTKWLIFIKIKVRLYIKKNTLRRFWFNFLSFRIFDLVTFSKPTRNPHTRCCEYDGIFLPRVPGSLTGKVKQNCSVQKILGGHPQMSARRSTPVDQIQKHRNVLVFYGAVLMNIV